MSNKDSDNRARERLHESLSAVLDGQASEFELRRVLDGMHGDDSLRQAAMRYQRIGDSIRRETNKFADIDLSAGISAAISEESAFSKDRGTQREKPLWSAARHLSILRGWGDSLGRVAVAASVVFAVVLGTRSYTTSQDMSLVADTGMSVSDATLSQPIQVNHNGYAASGILAGYNSQKSESISPEQLAYAQSVADRATRERFRAYALQHAELSVMSTGQGVLPFARLTSFDVQ